jgi:hypothetical protein
LLTTPTERNRGTETLSSQSQAAIATATAPTPASPSATYHGHHLSQDSVGTDWSIATGMTSMSLHDTASTSNQSCAQTATGLPTGSVDQNSYSSSPSVSYKVPGAFDEQGYTPQDQHSGYIDETTPTYTRTETSAGVQISNENPGTQAAEELSDPEKLQEVARNEVQPGPQDFGLPVHKLLRGTNSGDYEKLDSSKCGVF